MKFRSLLVVAVILMLPACAPIAPRLDSTDYTCEGGNGFRLLSSGDTRVIEINGMRFELEATSPSGDESVYRCSMLELSLGRSGARVAMEGRPYLAGCRASP